MAGKLNKTPEGKLHVFKEHFVYEVKMLQATYRFLRGPALSLQEPALSVVANALKESFYIHARNLIAFFKMTAAPRKGDVAACHFTKDSKYEPLQKIDGKLYGKLSAQVAHLSYSRTMGDEGKINTDDRRCLHDMLSREVQNFIPKLQEHYNAAWMGACADHDGAAPEDLQHVSTSMPHTQIKEILSISTDQNATPGPERLKGPGGRVRPRRG